MATRIPFSATTHFALTERETENSTARALPNGAGAQAKCSLLPPTLAGAPVPRENLRADFLTGAAHRAPRRPDRPSSSARSPGGMQDELQRYLADDILAGIPEIHR